MFSRTRITWTACSIILSCLFTVSAQAASGDVVTGSGSTASGVVREPTQKERAAAVVQLIKPLPIRKVLDDAQAAALELHAMKQADRTRLREFLQGCHDDLRRANRDQKFPTMLRCFRGRLMLELTALRKERLIWAEMKALTPAVQTAVLDQSDRLADALSTIVTAVDSNVYDTEEDLQEARRLLHSQYRLSHWTAVLHAHGNRLLAWVAYLAKDMQSLLDSPLWEDSVTCVENAADLLVALPATTTYDDALSAWSAARSQTALCDVTIQNAMKAMKQKTGTGGTL